MVRGTYLPLPTTPERVSCTLGKMFVAQLTSLGEEGAEALIGISGLALFGQVSIRLLW
jgi:hypothetical protein